MVTIIFESHGTTFDNENHKSSGHFDVALSSLGEKQAKELGERHKSSHFDAIFCSDLQRSYATGEIAFGKRFPIIKDARLRECDYGDWTCFPSETVEAARADHITKPFPNGESYVQTSERIYEFLMDLLKDYENKTIMIIGHRATQYGLEHWINNIPLEKAVTDLWHWQPGWTYELSSLLTETKDR
jgi:broad specificity phosphatase PhoE